MYSLGNDKAGQLVVMRRWLPAVGGVMGKGDTVAYYPADLPQADLANLTTACGMLGLRLLPLAMAKPKPGKKR